MEERKLATIRVISKLEPIEDADKIEIAKIDGWQCVVKKGEFKEGELCIYVEIDSILPEKPEFEFLRDSKFRIKTRKFRGTVSQGIVFPLTMLPKGKYKEGDDVTEVMGIVKFESQQDKADRLKNTLYTNRVGRFYQKYKWMWFLRYFVNKHNYSFPKFIKKTDEERIQNMPRILETEKYTAFSVTEKLDGSSATYFIMKNEDKKWWQYWVKDYVFGVCSRNLYKPKGNSIWWQIVGMYGLEARMLDIMKQYKSNIIIQGEIIGEKIQGNKYQLSGIRFYVFNIILFGGGAYKRLNEKEQQYICDDSELPHVPVICDEFYLPNTVNDMLDFATDKSVINNNVLREGVVIRNYDKHISFKAISPDFLIKNNE